MTDITDAEVEAVARIFAASEAANGDPEKWPNWAAYARIIISAHRVIEAFKPPAPRVVWVLFHQYGDGSSKARIYRVYFDEDRARQDFALVGGPGEWHCVEVPVVDGEAIAPETLLDHPAFEEQPDIQVSRRLDPQTREGQGS